MERKELYKRENALTLERAREDDGRRKRQHGYDLPCCNTSLLIERESEQEMNCEK